MYTLVRRYIKTAIIFLAAGIALGGWMLVNRELHGRPPTEYETSAHTHLIFVGFVMEMILGVALWLFPRPHKDDTRYSPRLVDAAYWLLTVGTAIRAAGELARASGMGWRSAGSSCVPGSLKSAASGSSSTPCGPAFAERAVSRARHRASDSDALYNLLILHRSPRGSDHDRRHHPTSFRARGADGRPGSDA